MRIGSLQNSDAQIFTRFPLIWSDGPIKILGIDIHPDHEVKISTNYEKIKNKVVNLLRAWNRRSLTVLGKIQIVNMLAILQFVHRMSCLPSPGGKIL